MPVDNSLNHSIFKSKLCDIFMYDSVSCNESAHTGARVLIPTVKLGLPALHSFDLWVLKCRNGSIHQLPVLLDFEKIF